ncbi:MAG: hypothetical protein Q4B17_08240 [Lautropia sp.]|nr:hypothetical protein [Lautropia sp.]
MQTDKKQSHLISDDPEFANWYVEAGIEERMAAPVVGRDHELVMKELQGMIDALKRKHDEAIESGIRQQKLS